MHCLLLIKLWCLCYIHTEIPCDAEPCQKDGAVRLVDRPSPNQNQDRLEVCSNNTWEIVCDLHQHSSGSDIAHVVCRQFNYSDLIQCLMQSWASCNHEPRAVQSDEEAVHIHFACSMLFAHIVYILLPFTTSLASTHLQIVYWRLVSLTINFYL